MLGMSKAHGGLRRECANEEAEAIAEPGAARPRQDSLLPCRGNIMTNLKNQHYILHFFHVILWRKLPQGIYELDQILKTPKNNRFI